MLHLTVEQEGEAIRLALSGRMDGGPCCDSLTSTVKSEIRKGHRNFVFDLEHLVSMSSRGIGCLVANHASIHAADGSMVLRAPNRRVRQVLTVTHLVPTVFEVIGTSPAEPNRGA